MKIAVQHGLELALGYVRQGNPQQATLILESLQKEHKISDLQVRQAIHDLGQSSVTSSEVETLCSLYKGG